MSAGLPPMVAGDGISKRTAVHFGGYNHTLGAGDGEIYDMENMTSDNYPVLATRKKRVLAPISVKKPNGFCTHKGVTYYVDGMKIRRMWQSAPALREVTDTMKSFVSLGSYLIILPDKKYYKTDGTEFTFGSLEAEMRDLTVQIQNGTYKGEAAKANTLYSQDAKWSDIFKAGDAVELDGFSEAANNKTIIIREIEGDKLRFYENSFVMSEDGKAQSGITIARRVPDMDFICENENRLWGCKGNMIYASKLGDPFNWNVFDGVSTDSFATEVGSGGNFTGCISYLGYPCFFKEDHIYKVYGDRPANFQVMGSASLGVSVGSGKSLAIAGETLFYLSRIGIVAYSGGIPQSIAEPFGNAKYKNAVAGSDGVKYYVSMEDEKGEHHFFVYDTRKNLWHREDSAKAVAFANIEDTMQWMQADGEVWQYGNARYGGYSAFQESAQMKSFVEFADFTDGDPNHKGTAKLQLRIELSENASVTVKMQFDSDGIWHDIKTLTTTKKKSFYLPIVPRRADHFRIRIEGKGEWRLYSMTRESYSGSEM